MTDEKRIDDMKKALRGYAAEAKAAPAGARKRMIETGIWTKAGKLRKEYGGEPKQGDKAA